MVPDRIKIYDKNSCKNKTSLYSINAEKNERGKRKVRLTSDSR